MFLARQVDEIETSWGSFCAAVENKEDVFDIYLRQSGLLQWNGEPVRDIDYLEFDNGSSPQGGSPEGGSTEGGSTEGGSTEGGSDSSPAEEYLPTEVTSPDGGRLDSELPVEGLPAEDGLYLDTVASLIADLKNLDLQTQQRAAKNSSTQKVV